MSVPQDTSNPQDWNEEEWLAARQEITNLVENEVTYAGLIRNIATAQDTFWPVNEVLEALANSLHGNDSVFYDFQSIYGIRHNSDDELDQFFNTDRMRNRPYQTYTNHRNITGYGWTLHDLQPGQNDAIARQFAYRVIERLGRRNHNTALRFLYFVVGLPGAHEHPRCPFPAPEPESALRRSTPPPPPPRRSTSPRRAAPPPSRRRTTTTTDNRTPVPGLTSRAGTGKVLNGYHKPTWQRHVAGPRRRLLCKETKNDGSGGRCTSLFQGYGDLMRHCRGKHGLLPGADYDVAGCGPFSQATVERKRPGHSFSSFGREKPEEESGGEEEDEDEDEDEEE